MAKVVNLVMVFTGGGNGSNSFDAGNEPGKVKSVTFRNQGAATVEVCIGGLSSPAAQLNPRESLSLPVSAGDDDNTTYYVKFTGSGTQNCFCIINKTMEV